MTPRSPRLLECAREGTIWAAFGLPRPLGPFQGWEGTAPTQHLASSTCRHGPVLLSRLGQGLQRVQQALFQGRKLVRGLFPTPQSQSGLADLTAVPLASFPVYLTSHLTGSSSVSPTTMWSFSSNHPHATVWPPPMQQLGGAALSNTLMLPRDH